MKHIRIIYGIVLASVIAPLFSFAQGGGSYGMQQFFGGGQFGGGGGGGSYYGQTRGLQINNFQSILGIINTLLGYMQVGIFLIALFYFLKGAFLIVKGDMAGGGKMLGLAAVGVAVAILAFSIIPLVCFITQSNGPACWL
jgi:hypothetical protein